MSDEIYLPAITAACAAPFVVEPPADADHGWIRVRRPDLATPRQGWKLHVSASPWSAATVLARVLPVLRDAGAAFKVAASQRFLAGLNQGDAGFSQIGKFVTVYPATDDQAVRLAIQLDTATAGLRGPAVPSDHPLWMGSLVSYRYGSFGTRHLQTPIGELVDAIVSPAGELVPDRRDSFYRAPDWVRDPFQTAGIVSEPPTRKRLIANRYLIAATIAESSRGTVCLAADLRQGRRCVLKSARANAALTADGRDARDRLRHEATILARLAAEPAFPAIYELIEDGEDLYLAMEDLAGQTLEAVVHDKVMTGRLPATAQVAAWGSELAGALSNVHAADLVYRDLKSTNVMIAPDGQLRLLDFELAHDAASDLPPYGRGTRGYVSPQQARGERPAPTDDIYSLGALLYFLATGAEPSRAPHEFRLLARPLAALNPAVSPILAAIITRCLHPDPAERFPSMAAVRDALVSHQQWPAAAPLPFGHSAVAANPVLTRQGYRDLARRLSGTLCATARPRPGEPGLTWISEHPTSLGMPYRAINLGAAGTILALAELTAAFGEEQHRAVLAEATEWLRAAPPPPGAEVPGLYAGEAGVGAALLRAGQVLADPALIAAAAARGRQIAALPHASPDLFTGSAGRLRFHLLLWEETGDASALRDAIAAGEALLRAAKPAEDGGLCWPFPPGYDRLSGRAFTGYAHGAAGIADALLDLAEATGRERFLATPRAAGRWLTSLAVPCLDDGSGRDWPPLPGQQAGDATWCHGAAGTGRFLLHAAQLQLLPEAAALAEGAARQVARGARAAGPVQCHGLAGQIELLLDVYQATGETAYLTEAHSLGRLLAAFASERDGLLLWPSDNPRRFTPDYMVGYAGIAVCLLRLSDPEHIPTQLSRRGFRYLPQPDPGELGRTLIVSGTR